MKTFYRHVVLFALVVVLGLHACKTTQSDSGARTSARTDNDLVTRTELFFGLAIPTGGFVSDVEWKNFLEHEITPRFPEGLTILDASGQFLMQDKTLSKEPTKIVIIFHPASEAADSSIEMIRATYKKRFHQESVLRVSSAVGVSF